MADYLTFISDTHLGVNRYFGLDIAVEAFKHVIDVAAESECKTLIHGGDFFNNANVGPEEMDSAATILSYLHFKKVKLRVNTGNHDVDEKWRSMVGHLAKYNIFKNLLDEIEVAVREPVESWLGGFASQDVQVVLLPYRGSLEAALAIGARRGYKKGILVAHADVQGARYDSGHISGSGWAKAQLDEIMRRFDLLIMGHIHLPQEFYGGRAMYIGAPLQFNFGAVEQMRGYLTLDLRDFKVTRYPLVGGKWPLFLDLPYDELGSAPAGAFVRVQADSSVPSDAHIIGAAKSLGIAYCKVEREEEVHKVVRRTSINLDDDPGAMASKFLDTLNLDEEERNEMLRIHEEVAAQVRGIR